MFGSDRSRPNDYRRAVVIDTGPKKYHEGKRSSEWVEEFVSKTI